MEMNGNIGCNAELSAVLIHADGSREDLGVLSTRSLSRFARRLHKLYRSLAKRFGMAVAALLLAGLVHGGHLPVYALPVLGIVTTAGVNYMASDFASGGVTPTISGFKFHASGTGVTAAAVGDTALGTDSGVARVSGTASNPTANQYRSVATMAYISTLAITEWGLFSASTVGTLWDRRVFSAINVVSGDSIQFTYTLTVNNGGT
jgi:hypothetical protein